ncbi:hypothetical protein M9435_006522 [Picochlorum sp. BPE23]|nr:hypothetical protein M9435_006522 [Picochlorum sp. BPE23]
MLGLLFWVLLLKLSLVYSARPSVLSLDQEPSKPLKTDRIAIIGGGVSGLTAAFRLEQLGYEGVTLYEQEDRFGGKVYSYDYNGHVYEVGAIWAERDHDVLMELATAFNFSLVPDPGIMLVRSGNGTGFNYNQIPSAILSEMILKYPSWSKVADKYGYLTEPEGFFHANDSDLFLNFDDFAKQNDIEVYASYFRPFWIGCGYGYYETTPAMYVLKLALQIAGGILGGGTPEPQFNSQLLIAPEGFQTLFVDVGESLKDARLNSKVTSIQRTTQGNATRIQVDVDGVTEVYDYLILTPNLRDALDYLDANEEEVELFTQVQSYDLLVQLTKTSTTTEWPTTVFFNQYGTANTSGHVVGMRNGIADDNVWCSGQINQQNASLEQMDVLHRKDFVAAGLSPVETVKRVSWNYFPHVDGKSLASGFYPKIDALQGNQNTFYLGSVFGFETVMGTADFANTLILKKFSSK